MHEEIKTPMDLIHILKRRRWSLIVPAAALFFCLAVIALALPPVYRASSTILIESQEIPRDYVVSTVTGYAEQRLHTITQRIMSATRLLEIIKQYDLYPEERRKLTSEEVVKEMRDDIVLDTIKGEVIDPRTGRPSEATIAFNLSYQGENPEVVQRISNVLASLYLEENLREREAKSLGATRFLEAEVEAVRAKLAEIDGRIALFKEGRLDALPELSQFNLQVLDRTERDIDQLLGQMRSLREREEYLQAQLGGLPPLEDNQDRLRLDQLRLQLIELQIRVSDEYPDVRRIKGEIARLEQTLGDGKGKKPEKAANPAYVNLAAQLAGVQSEIASLKEQLKGFYAKREEYRRRIENAPKVEEEYKALVSERNNFQLKFDDLTKKSMEAKVAQGLEKDRMGERFTLIEAARLPEKPVRPNRPLILLLGLILGLGAGSGLVALREFSDHSIRSAEVLARMTRLPVLASIPLIVTAADRLRHRRRTLFIRGALVLTALVAVLAFHLFVMDLDIVWAKVMRRLGI
ncbi:MAG: chain-length determining protein [Deltaproteobacteria bacterium]|nr:chain-length determining protein [Deltaproteobacteria bacterium]